jgi:hypothetical protein
VRHIGRSRIVALALLALLAAGPGALQAACAGCQAPSKAAGGPHCHAAGAAQVHAACCDETVWTPAAACCGPSAAAAGAATRAALAPASSLSLSLVSPAAIPVAAVRQEDTRPLRLSDPPPLPERVALHVLHSVFLI